MRIVGTLLLSLFLILLGRPCFSNPGSLESAISMKDFEGGKTLTASELAADLNYLSFAMSNAYSGFTFVPNKGSQTVLNDLATWPVPASMNSMDFYKVLNSETGKIQDDHFLVFLQRPSAPRPGIGVGSNFGKQVKSVWEMNWYDTGHQVPVVSIHAFQTPGSDWNGFATTIQNLMQSSRTIIIDLRDNGGGDDSEGKVLAQQLLDSDSFPTPYKSASLMQNPYSLEIFLNAIDWMALNWPGSDSSGWAQMKQQTEGKLKQALNGTLPAVEVQDFSKQNPIAGRHAYTGKVYVLINRNTASSGESTTDYLGALPFAKVVGENSAGAIHFGTMGLIELPNSKIVISLGIDYLAYRDGSFHELTGINPSVRVPDGQDALDYIVGTDNLCSKIPAK